MPEACSACSTLHGELDATLVLSVKIGITIPVLDDFVGFSHDFGLASAVLLDFNHLAQPHTNQLATIDPNGTVTLAVGSEAKNRKIYDVTGIHEQTQDEQDGNENYVITHVADDSNGETIKITAFGVSQTISGVRFITGEGDVGDLTVDVQQGVETDASFGGGQGRAFLTYSGTGSAELTAGEQNSTLIGGFGENTLLGGDGDDQLVGGSGGNLIEGYGGNNTIVVRVPTTGQNLILFWAAATRASPPHSRFLDCPARSQSPSCRRRWVVSPLALPITAATPNHSSILGRPRI